jgi:hypothetical protein
MRKVLCGNNSDRISVLDRKRPLAASIRGITRKNARENSVFLLDSPKKPSLLRPWKEQNPSERVFLSSCRNFGTFDEL